MSVDPYDGERTYQHGEFCECEGILYRASCSGKAMIGIAPNQTTIGNFWIKDEDISDLDSENEQLSDDVEPTDSLSGVVRGLNP